MSTDEDRRKNTEALAPMPRIVATAKMSRAELDEATAKIDAFRDLVDGRVRRRSKVRAPSEAARKAERKGGQT